MSHSSTFISEGALDELIRACSEQIREFLAFIENSDEASNYSEVDNKKTILSNIEPLIIEKAKQYQLNPDSFSNENLVQYGSDFKTAIQHPVRIEVRRLDQVSGAAQIAVRGVYGAFRQVALAKVQDLDIFKQGNYYIRFSGNASFEINISGVDKALPIKYFSHRCSDILKQNGYLPGPSIDFFKTKTIIAADGDGTTFDSPRGDLAPNLESGAAYSSLIRYLELGGVYLIISGNHLDRTVDRVKDFIPNHLKNRFFIAANGGANIIYFNTDGEMVELSDYRERALEVVNGTDKEDLDIIYIGDDGRSTGNDREAFEGVGAKRSILVAREKTEDMIPSLEENYVGGLVSGTKNILDCVNQWVQDNPNQVVFTEQNIKNIVQSAQQS